MKIFQIIFSFYILLLAFNPGYENGIKSGRDIECNVNNDSDGGDTSCHNGNCSPFSYCHCFAIQTQNIDWFVFKPLFIKHCCTFLIQSIVKFLPGYSPSFWQPPKI